MNESPPREPGSGWSCCGIGCLGLVVFFVVGVVAAAFWGWHAAQYIQDLKPVMAMLNDVGGLPPGAPPRQPPALVRGLAPNQAAWQPGAGTAADVGRAVPTEYWPPDGSGLAASAALAVRGDLRDPASYLATLEDRLRAGLASLPLV